MKEHSLVPVLMEFAEPIAKSVGVSIWGIRIMRGKSTIIQCFIDTEAGATIDNCTAFSRALGAELDIISEEEVAFQPLLALSYYTLEVSSPGVERQFFYIEQLEEYIGQTVDILLETPLKDAPNKRRYAGKLLSIKENTVEVLFDECLESTSMAWDDIERIRLQYFDKDTISK